MNTIFLLLTFLAVSGMCKKFDLKTLTEWMEVTLPYNERCVKESKVHQMDITKLIIDGDVSKNKSFGCFLNCLGESLNLYNAEKEFDKNTLMTTFSYVTERIADDCIKETVLEHELCQKSFLLGTCIASILNSIRVGDFNSPVESSRIGACNSDNPVDSKRISFLRPGQARPAPGPPTLKLMQLIVPHKATCYRRTTIWDWGDAIALQKCCDTAPGAFIRVEEER
ncbi:hypothetical protein FQA39_LY10006 [Lamprigera yunnana]|nr:hypothetical protein FQA39_LY10006 [Lamprigera yunnana]